MIDPLPTPPPPQSQNLREGQNLPLPPTLNNQARPDQMVMNTNLKRTTHFNNKKELATGTTRRQRMEKSTSYLVNVNKLNKTPIAKKNKNNYRHLHSMDPAHDLQDYKGNIFKF